MIGQLFVVLAAMLGEQAVDGLSGAPWATGVASAAQDHAVHGAAVAHLAVARALRNGNTLDAAKEGTRYGSAIDVRHCADNQRLFTSIEADGIEAAYAIRAALAARFASTAVVGAFDDATRIGPDPAQHKPTDCDTPTTAAWIATSLN